MQSIGTREWKIGGLKPIPMGKASSCVDVVLLFTADATISIRLMRFFFKYI